MHSKSEPISVSKLTQSPAALLSERAIPTRCGVVRRPARRYQAGLPGEDHCYDRRSVASNDTICRSQKRPSDRLLPFLPLSSSRTCWKQDHNPNRSQRQRSAPGTSQIGELKDEPGLEVKSDCREFNMEYAFKAAGIVVGDGQGNRSRTDVGAHIRWIGHAAGCLVPDQELLEVLTTHCIPTDESIGTEHPGILGVGERLSRSLRDHPRVPTRVVPPCNSVNSPGSHRMPSSRSVRSEASPLCPSWLVQRPGYRRGRGVASILLP